MQDVNLSHDPENLSKGQLLIESYYKFLYDNSLVSDKVIQIDNRLRSNKIAIPYFTAGAGLFAAFFLNPLFLSRSARALRIMSISFVTLYFFYRFHVNNNALTEEKLITIYTDSPRYIKRYLETKDHRHLLEAKFDVADFDPVTKKALPGK